MPAKRAYKRLHMFSLLPMLLFGCGIALCLSVSHNSSIFQAFPGKLCWSNGGHGMHYWAPLAYAAVSQPQLHLKHVGLINSPAITIDQWWGGQKSRVWIVRLHCLSGFSTVSSLEQNKTAVMCCSSSSSASSLMISSFSNAWEWIERLHVSFVTDGRLQSTPGLFMMCYPTCRFWTISLMSCWTWGKMIQMFPQREESHLCIKDIVAACFQSYFLLLLVG